MELTKLSYNNFNVFRNRLISYSRRFKIPFEDIEEIVNDSILKALEHFDNERGSFESLCLVIIKNRIFNFTRDNAHLYLLIILDENENILEADEKSIEEKENIKMALEFLNKLKEMLVGDEVRLFEAMYDTCETSKNISISKASRIIGLEPLKGWDVFRKIQRKAKDIQVLPENFSRKDIDFASNIRDVSEEMATYSIETPEDSDNGLTVFLFSLSVDNSKKLNSIYNLVSE